MEQSPAIPLASSFHDLRQLEFALLRALHQLQESARRLQDDELGAQIAQVLQTIASHSFSIGVVGEFKRGKSTFINALLGREILPADIAPTSATLNRVSYGLKPQALIQYKGEDGSPGRVEEIPIDQLAAYVTKLTPEAEAVASLIHEAVVYYPVPYCQNNVSIIDTPGMNDTGAMSAVTRSVLPRVDAAIMVMMPNSPLAGTEGAFLNELLANDLGKVLFVVTGIDKIPRSADRERLLERIRQRIKVALEAQAVELYPEQPEAQARYLGRIGEPKVFGLSGYDALQAKQTNDGALLAASGFTAFEQALERFLSEERGAIALKVIADRVAAAGDGVARAVIQRRARLQAEQQGRQQSYQAAVASYEQFRQKAVATLQAVTQSVSLPSQRLDALLALVPSSLRTEAELVLKDAQLTVEELNKASVAALGSAVQQGGQSLFDAVNRRLPEKVKDPGQSLWRQATGRVQGGLAGSLQTPQLDATLAHLAGRLSAELAAVLGNTLVIVRYELGRQIEALQQLNSAFEPLVARLRQSLDPRRAATDEAASRFSFLDALAQQSAEALERKRDFALHTHQALTETLIHELELTQFTLRQSQRAMLRLGQARNLLQPAERIELYKRSYLETLEVELQQHLEHSRLRERYREHVAHTYERLVQHVQLITADVEQQAQILLQLLRDQAEREALLDEQALLAHVEMQVEAERISAEARQLAEKLATLMAK